MRMSSSPLRLAVLTTGRQDYGILRSTLLALRGASDFDVAVLAGGMHMSARFGLTIDACARDGIPVAAALDFQADPPDPPGDAGRALTQVAAALDGLGIQALLLVGDRSETAAAALAATIARVPIAHMHGGEESEGAIDNALRHAITKLSHLHLVTHPLHGRRVVQMGEDPARVVVVGAPGLDNQFRDDLPDRAELEARTGLRLDPPVVLVTHHPATLGADPACEVAAIAAAMETVEATYVITAPNADRGSDTIRAFWERWVADRPRAVLVPALGERVYWGILHHTAALLGNSSSGMIEAADACVPSVNVGDRQKGRLCAESVLHAPAEPGLIREALERALRDPPPPVPLFPPGPAAPRVVAALKAWARSRTMRKSFHSIPMS
jgi:UDP-hydrolysing UDP-N-acetyl-D-glucosamine 2-epimerase